MAELPYMQLYVADYQADTVHLTLAEHGAYTLLLMHYWQIGKPLPNDDKKITRILRCSVDEWMAIKDIVVAFFYSDDDAPTELRHKRIDRDLARLREKSELARKSAKSRWKKKKGKNANADANAMLTEQNRTEQNRDTDKTVDNNKTMSGAPPPASRRTSVSDDGKKKSSGQAGGDPSKNPHGYTKAFEEGCWEAYPTHKNMSKHGAFKAWKKLTPDQKQQVIVAVPEFLKWLAKEQKRKPDYAPPHLSTWLNEYRFENFAEEAIKNLDGNTVGKRVLVPDGSPGEEAWAEWYRSMQIPMPGKVAGGWMLVSAFPPSRKAAGA